MNAENHGQAPKTPRDPTSAKAPRPYEVIEAVRTLLESGTELDPAVRAVFEAVVTRPAEPSEASPQGVLVIIINPNGSVVASASDFSRSSYGGYDLSRAQAMRAKGKSRVALAKSHLNEWMAASVDLEFAEDFYRHAEKSGYKSETIYVGWPEDVGKTR